MRSLKGILLSNPSCAKFYEFRTTIYEFVTFMLKLTCGQLQPLSQLTSGLLTHCLVQPLSWLASSLLLTPQCAPQLAVSLPTFFSFTCVECVSPVSSYQVTLYTITFILSSCLNQAFQTFSDVAYISVSSCMSLVELFTFTGCLVTLNRTQFVFPLWCGSFVQDGTQKSDSSVDQNTHTKTLWRWWYGPKRTNEWFVYGVNVLLGVLYKYELKNVS